MTHQLETAVGEITDKSEMSCLNAQMHCTVEQSTVQTRCMEVLHAQTTQPLSRTAMCVFETCLCLTRA